MHFHFSAWHLSHCNAFVSFEMVLPQPQHAGNFFWLPESGELYAIESFLVAAVFFTWAIFDCCLPFTIVITDSDKLTVPFCQDYGVAPPNAEFDLIWSKNPDINKCCWVWYPILDTGWIKCFTNLCFISLHFHLFRKTSRRHSAVDHA